MSKQQFLSCYFLLFILINRIQCSFVEISIGDLPIGKTSSALLSFTIEISQMYIPSRLCNFSDPFLINLARSLEPEIIRFGGTRADSFYYQLLPDQPQLAKPPAGYGSIITPALLAPVFQFAKALNARLLYGANAGLGPRLQGVNQTPTDFIDDPGPWMPDNFQDLANYCSQTDCPVAGWEFGNEPNLYPAKFNFYLPPSQYAKDVASFCGVVRKINPQWHCIASDVDYTPFLDKIQDFDEMFLPKGGSFLDHVTFHFYPLIATRPGASLPIEAKPWQAEPWKILDPYYLDQVGKLADRLFPLYHKYAPQASIILGETSSAVDGGQIGLSDRYVDSIEWMDKLGLLAGKGISVITRQTFCRTQSDSSFNYAIINITQPRPSYFPAVFFKQLMGNVVLSTALQFTQSKTRLNHTNISLNHLRRYAFCSKRYSGGIVVMFINLHPHESIRLAPMGSSLGDVQTTFLFSASALDSTTILVNQRSIQVNPDGTFPNINDFAHTTSSSIPITISPASYGFIEFSQANFSSCYLNK